MDGVRAGAVGALLLEGMDAVEPDAPGIAAIGREIGQRRRMAAGVPFLARGGAGVAADAKIEIDDEAELGLAGRGGRQAGHRSAPRLAP